MEEIKSVLGLKLPSDPRWADIAEKNLNDILTDHAYCEQKAASNCISLIVQYPEKEKLVDELSPVVTEEWGHFRMVVNQLKKRGLKLGRQRTDEYVKKLHQEIRKGGNPDKLFMDRLLVNALIEARSCERFKLLHQQLEDENLQKFYYDLMVSEAGHYKLFIQLAKHYLNPEEVDNRWNDLLTQEAKIIQNLAVRSDRMH